MSRVKIDPTEHAKQNTGPVAAPKSEVPDPGLTGPSSTFPITTNDQRVRDELAKLLEAARVLRPLLRENQARTEEEGRYSPEVHEYFVEHGFYKTLLPQRFGGLELSPDAYFAVIAEIGRGCPSTAWSLSLASAHTLTLSSYWPLAAQERIFGQHGYMVAPASGNPRSSTITPVEGGYRISGTWRYCSGAPYSTHFFPTVLIPATDETPERRAWAVLERSQYEVLNDWGGDRGPIGMRGSGSNGIKVEDAFVPEELVVDEYFATGMATPTIGYEIHGNPMYSGAFFGFAEGEVTAATLGAGYAALDEYERIIQTTRAPFHPGSPARDTLEDYLKPFGIALAKLDAAAGALFDTGRRYEEYGRRLVAGEGVFDESSAMRLNNAYLIAEELVWEAVQLLMRMAGTTFTMDGQRMQRYFRDLWTTVSRLDSLDVFATPTTRLHLSGEGGDFLS